MNMKRIGCFLALSAYLFALGTGHASASVVLRVEYSVDGGTSWADFEETSDNDLFWADTVNVSGTEVWSFRTDTSRNVGPPISTLSETALSLENLSDTTATITFRYSGKDYTFPSASPPDVILVSSLTGQMIQSVSGSGTEIAWQSYVHDNNEFFGGAGLSYTITSGFLGPQDLDGFASGQSFAAMENSVIGSLGSDDLSLSAYVTVTLNAGERLSYNSTQNLSPVPEPAALAVWSLLAGIGAAGVAMRRRRSGVRWSAQKRQAILEVIERS